MPRHIWRIVALLVVLFVGLHYINARNRSANKDRPTSSQPSAPMPLPAEAPTVAPSSKATPSKETKPKESRPTKNEANDDGESNIQPGLQRKIGRVVKLYASWPGSTPRKVLLGQLRSEEPFITESAVQKIGTEWNNTPVPTTFKMAPQKVVNISNLYAFPHQTSRGTATVFLAVRKLFKPVSGKAYSQPAVLPYTVTMEVIGRQWRVAGIAPQAGVSSTSSSS
jgi:hypothetical protein